MKDQRKEKKNISSRPPPHTKTCGINEQKGKISSFFFYFASSLSFLFPSFLSETKGGINKKNKHIHIHNTKERGETK